MPATFRYHAMDVAPDNLAARIQEAALAFNTFPPKPTKPSSPRKQVVVGLFDEIMRLKTHGYDFNEICELLVEKTGVEMTPGTLRKYWGAERRQRQGSKPRRKSPGKPKQSSQQPLHSGEQAEKQPTASVSTPATPARPVTPDKAREAQPGEDWDIESPSASEPEPSLEQRGSKSWAEDWFDDNPPAGGLLNEPRFNVIERD